MTGAADVHLDHNGRVAICGDVNVVGRVNNEGPVLLPWKDLPESGLDMF